MMGWLKNRRLFKPIGNIPPVEAETSFCASLKTEDLAAQPTEISHQKTQCMWMHPVW